MAGISLRARVPPEILVQDLEGESVFLDLKSSRYFGLNRVGSRMWEALTTQPSVEAAYQALLAEYEVDGDVLRRDLQALIDQLVAHGLVEISDGEVA